jgi:hypothetical protein
MNAEACNRRAGECASKAAIASDDVASEFLKLAAQWRLLAVRDNFLGRLATPMLPPAA